jgi:hypothetical protein
MEEGQISHMKKVISINMDIFVFFPFHLCPCFLHWKFEFISISGLT